MSTKKFIRFTNDASALEKTLRLLQNLAQILAALTLSHSSLTTIRTDTWLLARRQFALGRRFIRFFRWMECFVRAWEALVKGGMEGWLGVAKWGFMGAFLGCESLGILDIMAVYPSSFAKTLLIEGNKFWFYSIIFSIVLGVVNLSSLSNSAPTKREKHQGVLAKKKMRRDMRRRLVMDVCDLFVPGYLLGWIRAGSLGSAVAGCMSSLLAMWEILERI